MVGGARRLVFQKLGCRLVKLFEEAGVVMKSKSAEEFEWFACLMIGCHLSFLNVCSMWSSQAVPLKLTVDYSN